MEDLEVKILIDWVTTIKINLAPMGLMIHIPEPKQRRPSQRKRRRKQKKQRSSMSPTVKIQPAAWIPMLTVMIQMSRGRRRS